MDYRSNQNSKINHLDVTKGDVTGINLTIINGGVQINVVPAEIRIVFDIRLAVYVNQDEFQSQARKQNCFLKS